MTEPCSVPGCPDPGTVNVVAGPDTPSVLEPATIEDVLADGHPTFVEAVSCPGHVGIVRRHLQERTQPRRMAMREGRPPR